MGTKKEGFVVGRKNLFSFKGEKKTEIVLNTFVSARVRQQNCTQTNPFNFES
jgi:hypothetical protein